jgi:CHAD domain-containing protein
MHQFVHEQTAGLIHKLAEAVHQAAREADEESIHDVRVAMRRLSRCLRVFAPFYPDGYWKKIRHRLSALMAAAGAVRDCDIALGLLQQSGVSRRAAVMVRLAAARKKRGHELLREVRKWKGEGFQHKWKNRLKL